jgi:hypothetical protein
VDSEVKRSDRGKIASMISLSLSPADEIPEAFISVGDDLLARLSRPHAYRMKPRDFTVARAGVNRARRALVLPEAVARELLEQLHSWAAG